MEFNKYEDYKDFEWDIRDAMSACKNLQLALCNLQFNLERVDKDTAQNIDSMLKIIKVMRSALTDISK